MTDWSDQTLRPLDELARIAFPEGSGVTGDTLKRRARKGQLRVYRPGKAFLSTMADVWAMVEGTCIGAARVAPDQLGLSAAELSHAALEQAREALRRREEQRIEDEWERKYEARKAAERQARPPRK
ncbi:hypothetical protein XH99_31825 [Bradyrhizobium nanningense]|uniref:Uncharacterized protein n=1 Tax=Bradyrhizobium nanningense TaxID=1325118 RepID=A0A4V1L157_9BRAD|nr:hypothetical protein [Bradyrhizobium nanningense]RXH23303.1 hypothetical protein XH99_31825 [Bradyrhizobium nanningense]RXH27596.1 hypothetical protein XH84_29810 [Bradyrhizobium nanningense]